MTIDELIAALEKMRDKEGGDTIVVVRGYESGYDRVDDVGALSRGPADDDGVADAGHRPHVDAGVALRLKECVRAHGVAGLGVGQ